MPSLSYSEQEGILCKILSEKTYAPVLAEPNPGHLATQSEMAAANQSGSPFILLCWALTSHIQSVPHWLPSPPTTGTQSLASPSRELSVLATGKTDSDEVWIPPGMAKNHPCLSKITPELKWLIVIKLINTHSPPLDIFRTLSQNAKEK